MQRLETLPNPKSEDFEVYLKRYNRLMPRRSTPPAPEHPLFPNEILIAEFEYAANSAFQANEDRSKAASFFLISVGSLVAAIFGAQRADIKPETYFVLAGLFLALTFLGTLTVMQLARLREAWAESARVMNRIKDFYVERFKEIELEKAFHWRAATIPEKYKPRSISYFTVLEVALLSGLTFGASAFFLQAGFAWTRWREVITASVAIAGFVFQLRLYRSLLTNRKFKETT